jgi:hypothetical protein
MTELLRCEQVDELLPDYLEDSLDVVAKLELESHVRSCVRCTGLVADLNDIRTEAAALPELSPSRDLWDGIAARIDTPVVSISAAPSHSRQPVLATRRWLAAAAVALIAVSSGATYMMMRASSGSQLASAVDSTATPVLDPAIAPAPTVPVVVAQGPDTTSSTEPASNASPASPRVRSVAAPRNTNPTLDQTYEREVAALRRIVTERSDALDPKTVAILEASLRMIDTAIAQSRQALAADPASRFLRDQLNKALDLKVEVLRTAAMLPSRT